MCPTTSKFLAIPCLGMSSVSGVGVVAGTSLFSMSAGGLPLSPDLPAAGHDAAARIAGTSRSDQSVPTPVKILLPLNLTAI